MCGLDGGCVYVCACALVRAHAPFQERGMLRQKLPAGQAASTVHLLCLHGAAKEEEDLSAGEGFQSVWERHTPPTPRPQTPKG